METIGRPNVDRPDSARIIRFRIALATAQI